VEARTAFRGTGISKSMAAIVVAVLAALVLVAVGAYLASAISRPIAPPATHIVAGQPGSTWTNGNGRHGTMWIEEQAPASGSSFSRSLREP
jgi:hypothetical protein